MTAKIGKVVWHDLFTPERAHAMAFYQRLAGWRYVTEISSDFAWGDGEGQYVLALLGDEAGAGLVEISPGDPRGWVPYVEVADADRAVQTAISLGGIVIRPPFDVPGVGRNALLRDPAGALIGLAVSAHSFPVPKRQFGADIHYAPAARIPTAFYSGLFGEDAAWSSAHALKSTGHNEACWIPTLRVSSIGAAAKAVDRDDLVAAPVPPDRDFKVPPILQDPDGTLFGLCE